MVASRAGLERTHAIFVGMGVVLSALAAGCDAHPSDAEATDVRTIDSAGASPDASGPVSAELACAPDEQKVTYLALIGPGWPTPTQAVAPHADGNIVVVRQDGGAATVNVFDEDGMLARVFEVTLRKDGWSPETTRECVH